jgi:hypothetical protein
MTRRALAVLASIALGAGLLIGAGAPAQAAEADPVKDDCLAVDGDLWDSLAPFEVVECTERHNSEVIVMMKYPNNAGAPSTIANRVLEYFGNQCTYDVAMAWLGAGKIKLPLRMNWWVRLPSDEQWEAGARWAACGSIRPGPKGGPETYTGTLPAAFASTPLRDWVVCTPGTPKSGQWSDAVACTSKTKWLTINGIFIKGKPGKNYPKDFQAKADALCAKNAKPYLKKGSKTKPIAGLGPAKDFPPGEIFGNCFIALADWNGKGR